MNHLKINPIDKFKSIHGKLYDYSKFQYIGCEKKSIIICKNHGEFLQSYGSHSRGKGCPECKKEKIGNQFRSNNKAFIKKANIIHNKKYTYKKIKYINSHTKIRIECPSHKSFFQTPSDHLNGCGCPKCGIQDIINKRKGNSKDFIKKSKVLHNNKYDYSNVIYGNNAHVKVNITCPIHGNFFQTPNSHLRKSGCPKCVNKISKPEIEFLDYLKIPNTKETRQVNIKIKKIRVDGYEFKTKTVYEFLGDYYHGNPIKYDQNKYNPTCKKTFGELYKNTFNKFKLLKNKDYVIKYIWEADWNKFKKGIHKQPNIILYN